MSSNPRAIRRITRQAEARTAERNARFWFEYQAVRNGFHDRLQAELEQPARKPSWFGRWF